MWLTKEIQHGALAVLAAGLLMGLKAHAQDPAPESIEPTVEQPYIEELTVERSRIDEISIQFDNDLFAGRDDDRDYTGGMTLTLSGTSARDGLLSLDPLLARLDKLTGIGLTGTDDSSDVYYARQLGLMAFTPSDTLTAEPQQNDRPYASLLFVSNGRVQVDPDNRGAWSSSLTIGVLGLSLSERLHSAVHQFVGSERPEGYDNQISAGGEPTARYTLARHKLWIANPTGTVDVKTTMQGSVGYLTETSAAISMRIGRFDTAWWSFAPELTDYAPAPVPVKARHAQRELYFFAGARVKARVYNAMLQGQFRDSVVRYSASEIEPLLAEAWIGFVTQILEQTQLSYTVHYQTAELRYGDASRDALWGAVQIAHSF